MEIRRRQVPARTGVAVAIRAGDRVTVTDTYGGQVGDLFAFVADDPNEHLSASHTRSHVGRLFPALGEDFVTDVRRPILRLVGDTSPGAHDMLIAACDPQRYAALGAAPGHRSCAENLRAAMAEFGRRPPYVPQPVNVFMDVAIDSEGCLDSRPARTRAGDHVEFRALLDCLIVLSACPQDLTDINAGGPGPLTITVHHE